MLWACRPPTVGALGRHLDRFAWPRRSVGDGGWVLEPRACGPGLVVTVCC